MIGVMFLIAVISIVEGMQKYVEEDFAAKIIGTNTFTLRRFPNVNVGDISSETWREYVRRPRLYQADIALAQSVLPNDALSSVETIIFATANSPHARPRQVMAVGSDAEYFRIKAYDIERGRAFTAQEVQRGIPVAVIGTEIAEHFFPNLDPIGRELRLAGLPYQIIGVLEKQGSVFGFSMDRLMISPWTSPIRRVTNPSNDIDALVVQAPSDIVLGEAMEAVREVMRSHRKVPPSRPDNFALETSESAIAFFADLKSKLIVFGTALPAIGLLVGAMVIMNIMLVAVAERTHEIGVRKALGARRSDIMSQFLVEAATLSVVGAAIGIATGIGIAKVISAVSPLPAAVAPWSIVLALLLGAGVGIVAGAYPASRASRLDPIAALRQE